MSTKTRERRFVVATNTSRGEQLCDQILAIRPLGNEIISTKVGDSEATIARVVEVTDVGDAVDHGEFPVFWTVVRAQLAKATEQAPWVAGRLVKVGQAYRLDTLTPAEEDLVDQALAQVGDL